MVVLGKPGLFLYSLSHPQSGRVRKFQSSHDSEKLDILLEEAAILRCRVRRGESRKEKCKVVTAFVYLKGVCPNTALST